MSQPKNPSSGRRSFLTHLNTGAAAIAAVATLGLSRASAQTIAKAPAPFVPARHDQDEWMDQVPGKHRMVFDTIDEERLTNALMFGTNFLVANRSGYGLQSSDIAIIVVIRHMSTGFGFNDAMWAKYGSPIAAMSSLKDVPKVNLHIAGGMGIDSLVKEGVQYAICAMATRRIAGGIAQATGGKTDDINTELIANLIPNARMVPAGIVAVNRAQERGYTLVTP